MNQKVVHQISRLFRFPPKEVPKRTSVRGPDCHCGPLARTQPGLGRHSRDCVPLEPKRGETKTEVVGVLVGKGWKNDEHFLFLDMFGENYEELQMNA